MGENNLTTLSRGIASFLKLTEEELGELYEKSKKVSRTLKKRESRRREYERNLLVKALTLKRAKGICENCKQIAPFNRKYDGEPYLEVHHIVPLAANGEDSLDKIPLHFAQTATGKNITDRID